jgi:hypothetical protein
VGRDVFEYVWPIGVLPLIAIVKARVIQAQFPEEPLVPAVGPTQDKAEPVLVPLQLVYNVLLKERRMRVNRPTTHL